MLPKPNDAVAAIIVKGNEYLLQLRDSRSDIYFPEHWGLFGGAVDFGETDIQAIRREIYEELGIKITPTQPLMSFEFNLSEMQFGIVRRKFYEIFLDEKQVKAIKLGEGKDLKFFSKLDVLNQKVVPYDAYAIWWHINESGVKKYE